MPSGVTANKDLVASVEAAEAAAGSLTLVEVNALSPWMLNLRQMA